MEHKHTITAINDSKFTAYLKVTVTVDSKVERSTDCFAQRRPDGVDCPATERRHDVRANEALDKVSDGFVIRDIDFTYSDGHLSITGMMDGYLVTYECTLHEEDRITEMIHTGVSIETGSNYVQKQPFSRVVGLGRSGGGSRSIGWRVSVDRVEGLG